MKSPRKGKTKGQSDLCRQPKRAHWWESDGYGLFGKPIVGTTPYKELRIKRYRKRGNHKANEIIFVKLQKKGRDAFNRPAWVTLGCYDTVDEALEMLEYEAELMELIEELMRAENNSQTT